MSETDTEPPFPAALERMRREPVTIDMLVRILPRLLRDYIAECLEPLAKRVAAIEHRPQLRYAGVWTADRTYAVGNVVTHSGSAWHCNAETTDRPGASPCWTLMVKRGGDAR